jgi:hypothetical protein
MGRKIRRQRPARGFGTKTSNPDEEIMMLGLLTQLALNMASERVSELDETKSKTEWIDWFMEKAQHRLSEVESEEEMESLFLDM